MSFTAKDVTGWLTVPRETEHLEFKAAREQFDTEKLLRYCVALANEGGGRLRAPRDRDHRDRRIVTTQIGAS